MSRGLHNISRVLPQHRTTSTSCTNRKNTTKLCWLVHFPRLGVSLTTYGSLGYDSTRRKSYILVFVVHRRQGGRAGQSQPLIYAYKTRFYAPSGERVIQVASRSAVRSCAPPLRSQSFHSSGTRLDSAYSITSAAGISRQTACISVS